MKEEDLVKLCFYHLMTEQVMTERVRVSPSLPSPEILYDEVFFRQNTQLLSIALYEAQGMGILQFLITS